MSGWASGFYNNVFRRNQTFLAVVFASAFGIEMALDTGGNSLWDYINKGRQWKDIKYRYVQKEDEDEE